MNRRCFSVIALGAVLLLGTGAAPHKLVATWVNPDHAGLTLQKIAIVGISADREIRHRFEDKFVSHLRGRNHDAVTSYSLVPDLATCLLITERHPRILPPARCTMKWASK